MSKINNNNNTNKAKEHKVNKAYLKKSAFAYQKKLRFNLSCDIIRQTTKSGVLLLPDEHDP